jgi:hypothetical protein
MELPDRRSNSVPASQLRHHRSRDRDRRGERSEYYAGDSGEPMATAAVVVMLSVVVLWALAGALIGEFLRQRRLTRRAAPGLVADAGDVSAPVMIRE